MFILVNICACALILVMLVLGFGLSFSQQGRAHDKGMALVVTALATLCVWIGIILGHLLHI